MLPFLLIDIASNTLANFYDSETEITWLWIDFKNCLKSVRKELFEKSYRKVYNHPIFNY